MRWLPLAALLAVPVRAAEGPVSLWFQLPPGTGEEGLASLDEADDAVKVLLGASARRESRADEQGTASVRWTAPGWDAGLAPERREALLSGLRQRWGERFRVDLGGPSPAAPRRAAHGPDRRWTASQSAVARDIASSLKSPPSFASLGTTYDGSSLPGEAPAAPPPAAAPVPKAPVASGPPAPAAQLPQGFATTSAAPPGPGRFDETIRREAAAAGLDPAVLHALVQARSGFDPERRGGGAYGLMMVSPGAAVDAGMKGADLMDPEQNIRAGARYYARLLRAFRGDEHRALAAYQAGPGAVFKSGGIPNRPDVKAFLAAYERAYRAPGEGRPKPAVAAVRPPAVPIAHQAADALASAVVRDPKDPLARYRPLVEAAAARRGVDARLLEAIMRKENPWGDPNRVSPAGAVGLMQLMPGTARALGVDPRKPSQAIDGAARHLAWLLSEFGGDRVKAVAAYNAGDVPVRRLGRVPNYRETVGYVAEVFANYEDLGGERVDYSGHMTPRAQGWARRALARRD